ncbi:MAG: pentapeptide repeat-containing protein, partial [Polyangiaceae bacterium]
LTGANLTGANLEEASMLRAQLRDAQLRWATARGVRLTGAMLLNATFVAADLTNGELSDVDARRASFAGAKLDGVTMNAARVHGIVGTGTSIQGMKVDWIDSSADANGSGRLSGDEAVAFMAGMAAERGPAGRRYFGKGDVMRNAALEFNAGVSVEVESLFEHCSIALGEGTELVIGKAGVLSGCQIKGAGKVTVHGKFVEREAPGIVGVSQLVVTSGGSIFAAVEQPPELTRFAFEPGCVLRMKIQSDKGEKFDKKERPSKAGRQR